MGKHIQTIIDNFTYRKLWYICGKLNITMYELLKNYINDFVKKKYWFNSKRYSIKDRKWLQNKWV